MTILEAIPIAWLFGIDWWHPKSSISSLLEHHLRKSKLCLCLGNNIVDGVLLWQERMGDYIIAVTNVSISTRVLINQCGWRSINYDCIWPLAINFMPTTRYRFETGEGEVKRKLWINFCYAWLRQFPFQKIILWVAPLIKKNISPGLRHCATCNYTVWKTRDLTIIIDGLYYQLDRSRHVLYSFISYSK